MLSISSLIGQAPTTHQCQNNLEEVPHVNPSCIDNLLTPEDYRTKSASVQTHVVRALEERAASAERDHDMMKESVRVLAVKAKTADDLRKALVPQPADRAQVLDRSLEIISYETSVGKTIAAMRSGVLRQKQQAGLAYAECQKHIDHYGESNEAEKKSKANLKTSLDKENAAYEAALTPVNAYIEAKLTEYEEFGAEPNNDAQMLVDKLGEIALEFKAFMLTTASTVTLKDKVKRLQEFNIQTKKVIEKHVREKAKANTQRGALAAFVAQTTSNLEKSLAEKMTIPPEAFGNNYLNVKWQIKTDLLENAKGEVVVVPKERVGKFGQKIREHEYYESQKAWSHEAMQKGKLTKVTTTIVKPSAMKICRAHMQGCLGKDLDLQQISTNGKNANLAEIFEPKFYQALPGASTKGASTDYGLVDIRLQLEGFEHIFGIPRELVPGATLQDKHVALGEFGVDDFLAKVKDVGFYLHMGPDQLATIPGNFAIVTVADTAAAVHGIRMLIPGRALRGKETVNYLNECITFWPELKGSVHDAVAKYVQGVVDAEEAD